MSKSVAVVAGFLFLQIAFANGAQAVVVKVHCGTGSASLKGALQNPANDLVVTFDGVCNEDVAIERGNVTIRGLDSSATIRGAVTVLHDRPTTAFPSPAGPVVLENLSIVSSSKDGLAVGTNDVVVARHLSVSQSAGVGIHVYGGGWLRCIDCLSTANASHGIEVIANGTAELAGTCSFSGNTGQGISVVSSGEVSLYDRATVSPTPVANITVNGNGMDGIVVADGGSILSAQNTVIVANGNGVVTGSGGTGSGILIGTGGAGFLSGSITVDGDVFGIASFAGKLFVDANVSATNNTSAGLFVNEDGTLRLLGSANHLNHNLIGARVDGSYLRLFNTTFNGNTTADLFLRFGAKAKLTTSAPSSVSCDTTTLLSGANCSP